MPRAPTLVVFLQNSRAFTLRSLAICRDLLRAHLRRDSPSQVPPGIQPNDQRVISGKGIKRINATGYGDMFIRFIIAMPTCASPVRACANTPQGYCATVGSSSATDGPRP